jgi:F420-non-reducing hydrogenase iron-sulfur subunit
MGEKEFEPKIIAFCCNWCSYTGADLAGTSRFQMPPTFRNIRVMCSSRVDPLFIIKAYLNGADGVLVAGCHPGDCHYTRGNYFTRRRMALIEKVLESVGLEADRVMLSWISASEGLKCQEVTEEFTKKIKELGKNGAKNEIFL